MHRGALHLTFGVALPRILPFIVFDFSLADADGDLDPIAFPIEREWDEGAAFGGAGFDQLPKLVLVNKQLSGSAGGMVPEVAVGILVDVSIVEPEFAIIDAGERIAYLAATGTQGFDFGAA